MNNITSQWLEVENIAIKLTRKRIKNLHLRICPPLGEVRVSAPLRLDDQEIHKFIFTRISWIKEKQNLVRQRKMIAPQKFLDGENHNFFGQKLLLRIIEGKISRPLKSQASLHDGIITLHIKKRSNIKQRKKILDAFYRAELKKIIPHFITKFEEKMDVEVVEFGIKKMKTRWGTCNAKARRIWLNLELAKKPIACLEYLIAHEMTHFFERGHNKKFFALMDKFLPEWQKWKKELSVVR